MESNDRLLQFQKQGYLVIEDFASHKEVAALRQRAEELTEGFSPEHVTLFTTSGEKVDPTYFYTSANNISFFLEQGSMDENGKLTVPKNHSVNKIGHALHDLDEVFVSFSRSPKIASLLKELEYRSPIPVQSMYICKPPRIGGYVTPHEDGWFLMTEPPSVIGVWLAVEDATIENGCLYMKPASHFNSASLTFERDDSEQQMPKFKGDRPEYDLSQFVPLPVKAGTVVVFDGATAHYSNENRSDTSRHAYSVHYVEGAEGYHWSEKNWIQRTPDFPFKPLY